MELIELLKDRFSVRKFSNKEVEEKKINKIIEAGLCAPTACNNQPCRIHVVKTKEALEKLSLCTECHYNEPLAFIITYMEDEVWVRSYDSHNSGDVDASIITTQMMLESYDLGLGSCWIMYFIPDKVKEEFNLEKGEIPAAILFVGYAADGVVPSIKHTNKKDKNIIVKID